MRTPVTLGPYTFPSKRDAELHIRQVLHGTRSMYRLHPDDEAMVRDLIALHPNAEEKIGTGISHIRVVRFKYGAPCFWIERVDGTATDFSYKRALYTPTRRTDVLRVLRDLIEPQIDEFVDDTFPPGTTSVICPITGYRLTRSFGEVHHDPPFSRLVEDFLDFEATRLDDIPLITSDATAGRRLADPQLADRWCRYHAAAADLMYIHPSANRLIGAATDC